MHGSKRINAECRVYTRYLTGQLPDDYISKKYAEALSPGQPLGQGLQVRFDALLLRLAAIHPLFTRAVDAFSRFFYTNSTLRKRLIMLLALLETQAATAAELDYPDKAGMTEFMLAMIMQLTVFAILLGVATLFLLPLKLLFGKQPVKY